MKKIKLDDTPKIESGFKIPDNYFEDFSSKFMQNLPRAEKINEVKVISIFRKRRTIFMAVAAVFVLALMIPIINFSVSKNKELDSVTIENYLVEESNLNQYELIGDMESENNTINTKESEDETIEDILITNPNIENLVIEN